MRIWDRSIVGSVLVLAGVAATPIIACSSSDGAGGSSSGGTGDEGGIITPGGEGGATVDGSTPATPCEKAADCSSGVCNLATKLCSAATCMDGVKNASETDLDCGGGACSKCDVAKGCKTGDDCTTGVCKDTGKGLQCQAPTNTDGVKNGTETGIDCGGTGNLPCADGQGCVARTDCTSSYCKANVCTAAKADDGVQNGDETDVDCGGMGGSKACSDGLKCVVGSDCSSLVCTGLVCQVPSTTDKVKNGTETDVDCGGASGRTCATGQTCLAGGDCSNKGCDYNFKCADARSCTAHYGGDTCGFGGDGSIGPAAWESCCTTVATPSNAPDAVVPAGGGATVVYMDKYPTTSGRMRVFLESVGYDVRTAVQTMRADGQIPKIPLTMAGAVDNANSSLDANWDMYLPTSLLGNNNAGELSDCTQGGTCTRPDGECGASKVCLAGTTQGGVYTSVFNHLGRTIFKNNTQSASGCFAGAPGTHSFRFPDGTPNDGSPEFDQTIYDTRSLNCTDYLMAQAFCAWDGGRLETLQEWLAAWDSSSTPFSVQTPLKPATPGQRYSVDGTRTARVCAAETDCPNSTILDKDGNPTTVLDNNRPFTCSASKCVLRSGDKTYDGCRFPFATDASHNSCSLEWPTTTSIEYSDYLYSYQWPAFGKNQGADYIVFLTPPGRTRGRSKLGHSDIIGAGYEILANVNYATSPLDARHIWSGNGSWEVHGYQHGAWGGGDNPGNTNAQTELINKYGKLGMRCVKFAPPPAPAP